MLRGAGGRAAARALAMALPLGAATVGSASVASRPTARATAVAPVPGCTTLVSRAGLAEAGGARIASVRVVTHPPRPFRGPARLLNRFHARTVAPTVRRELLFVAGDTVIPIRVAESLRRLRNLGFLEDAWLTAVRCGTGDDRAVALTVETRDAWSTVPEGRWTAVQQTLGLHETNLLGTGRTLSVVLRWDADRLGDTYRFGGQVGISDPAVTPNASAGASYVAYADGRAWAMAAGSRRRSLADPWTASAAVSQAIREPADLAVERVRRERAAVLVGRRVSAADAAPTALYLLGGFEAERTRLDAAAGSAVIGPLAVRRSFVGPNTGVALRAVRFDTLTWLLPRRGIADVPRGTEAEIVVGGGRDIAAGVPAVHLDGWMGRVWQLRPRSLVAADVWAGGYVNGAAAGTARSSGVSAASLRGLVSAFRATRDGLWSLRGGAERRVQADPDARPFVGLDPTAPLLAGEVRLAAATATIVVERSTHLRAVTRALVLDGAAFGAASGRWHPASDVAGDPVTLGVVGVGLRLSPTRPGQPTAGLDLGYPVVRPTTVRRGPVVRVLLAPWFGSPRGRGR